MAGPRRSAFIVHAHAYTTTSSNTADEKPPKQFSAWAQCVETYNAKLLDGKRRKFPTDRLLEAEVGAEEVLARLYHKHTKSKLYTPFGLGEILSRRTFTPEKSMNPLATPGSQRRQRGPDPPPGQRRAGGQLREGVDAQVHDCYHGRGGRRQMGADPGGDRDRGGRRCLHRVVQGQGPVTPERPAAGPRLLVRLRLAHRPHHRHHAIRHGVPGGRASPGGPDKTVGRKGQTPQPTTTRTTRPLKDPNKPHGRNASGTTSPTTSGGNDRIGSHSGTRPTTRGTSHTTRTTSPSRRCSRVGSNSSSSSHHPSSTSRGGSADLIVLAPFDGVGAAHFLIKERFGTPLLALSWEIDRACCKVLHARTPWVAQDHWRHDLGRIRRDALQEISLLQTRSELTSEWMAQRPSSVRRTFCTPDKDLLEMVGYPDVSNFRDDFANASLIGE